MRAHRTLSWPLTILTLFLSSASAEWRANTDLVEKLSVQRPNSLYREEALPTYSLPDPLESSGNPAVRWQQEQRPQILEQFKKHVYGRVPVEHPAYLRFELTESDTQALGGLAVRKQVRMIFSTDPKLPRPEILFYLPAKQPGPVPLFLTLNFRGNHTIWLDPEIHLPTKPKAPDETEQAYQKRLEDSRGDRARRFPVTTILSRGYGLATIYYEDLEPDRAVAGAEGLRFAVPNSAKNEAWGAIAAWAWGFRRAMDYCETDRDIDHTRAAVLGHSRLGKTALWAGATDERFAMVVSNNSGCGGAALSRRRYGESVQRINTSFPHWFCENFKQYNQNENALPVDQHMLIALIAPRPVCVGSADLDLWADPRGEFLSCKHASAVYEHLAQEGLGTDTMPDLDQPIQTGRISYHIRSGKHDLTLYDWERYLDFADKHLRTKPK